MARVGRAAGDRARRFEPDRVQPDPVRIAETARVGSTFSGLPVNQAEAEVLIDTSNRDRGALPVGAEVTVTLPDGSEMTGTVVEQEQVVGADGSRIWRTTIHTSRTAR